MSTYPDDLLSAWFDGEASDEERRAAERLLADSDDARREADELRRLSGLLHALPAAKAPRELVSAVMQRAERATLLPDVEPARSVRRTKFGGWAAVAAGVAATAALVLLMSGLMGPVVPNSVTSPHGVNGRTPEDVALHAGGADASLARDRIAPKAGEQFGSFAAPEADTVPPVPGNSVAGGQVPRSLPHDTRLSGARPEGPLVEQMAPPAPGAADSPTTSTLEELATDEWADIRAQRERGDRYAQELGEVVRSLDGRALQPGQVVRYLHDSGDRVAVIEVTVVDVDEAAGRFRSYLFAQDAQNTSGERAGGERGFDDRARRFATREEQTELAVYVEATEEQLTGALAAISDEVALREAVLMDTVAVEQRELLDLETVPEPLRETSQDLANARAVTLREATEQLNELERYGQVQGEAAASPAPELAQAPADVPKEAGSDIAATLPTEDKDLADGARRRRGGRAPAAPVVLEVQTGEAAERALAMRDNAPQAAADEGREFAREAGSPQRGQEPAPASRAMVPDPAIRIAEPSAQPTAPAAEPHSSPVRVILVFRGVPRDAAAPMPN